MYDSPLTPETVSPEKPVTERHGGEYVIVKNVSSRSMNLDYFILRNDENGTQVQLGGSLVPGGEMLIFYAGVNYGNAMGLGNYAGSLDPVRHTALQLDDTYGRIRLLYGFPGEPTQTMDAVDYGSMCGLTARNRYVPDSLLDSLGRRIRPLHLNRVSYSPTRSALAALALDPPSAWSPERLRSNPQPYDDQSGSHYLLLRATTVYEMKNCVAAGVVG